jgi:hypothetical protein
MGKLSKRQKKREHKELEINERFRRQGAGTTPTQDDEARTGKLGRSLFPECSQFI